VAGAVPLVVWEAWGGSPASAARLSDIVRGLHDALIRSFARDVAEFGRPVLLAPLHEPNGSWYPWSTEVQGNPPAEYRAAWRRIHRIFRSEGAVNVRWVWAAYSLSSLGQSRSAIIRAYPGDRYVDWTAVAGLNFGTAGEFDDWRSADDLLRTTYAALTGYAKPVMVLELGTTASGGNAAAWVHDTFAALRADYPRLKALVWYDNLFAEGVDFRLRGAARDAFRTEADAGFWRAEPVVVPGSS